MRIVPFSKVAAVASLTALGCAAFATPATAHEVSSKTRVVANYEMRSPDGNAVVGELRGPGRCIKRRLVSFVELGGGSVGQDLSSRSGAFDMDVDGVDDGDYVAKVRKRTIRRPGHKHVCRSGRSPEIAIAGDCTELVLSGGPNPADSLTVDDDIVVELNATPVFTDNDEEADDIPPVALGATTGGESLRVIASNSTVFGGPMSLDPLWIHCVSRSVSFALDSAGFTSPGGDFGEVFYDETFIVPDIVP